MDPDQEPAGGSCVSRMMNIVLARGDKVEKTIYNAQSIGVKYSISTEYLTTSAWKCQTQHGMYFDPYERSSVPPLLSLFLPSFFPPIRPPKLILLSSGPIFYSALPTDPNADCLVNLPVCDCTRQGISSLFLARALFLLSLIHSSHFLS
jgi:hypothetical protein